MYITFLDSDDVLADGAVQKMLDAAFGCNAEILQGSWYTFSGEETENHIIPKEGVLNAIIKVSFQVIHGENYTNITLWSIFNFLRGSGLKIHHCRL